MKAPKTEIAIAARELIRSLDGARDQAKIVAAMLKGFITKADNARVDFEALLRQVEETPYNDKRSTRPPRKP
jgi:hypothetical protein